jgi:hypothetical protein
MRTKALLLTAAIGAVGIATSMAQNVYSVNIVGYVNKTLPTGLSTFANQLNATPNNRVTTLIPAPQGALTISKFNPTTGSFNSAIYDTDGGWDDPTSMVLNPGQGAFADNSTGAPQPLTFVGEVQLSSTVTIHPGLDMYSSVSPQAGDMAALGFPVPPGGISLFKYNPSAGRFDTFVYDPDNPGNGWDPIMPSMQVADAFFIDAGTNPSFAWTRTFPVGP